MRQGWCVWLLALCAFSFPLFLSAGEKIPFPSPIPSNIQLKKTAIEISYNPFHKIPEWVFYSLSVRELRSCVKRSIGSFRPDPNLPAEISAQLSDYSKSGFDRGHFSPAGDNKWSAPAMKESFLLSNISPQPPRFNQGIWARLENLVRSWAIQNSGVWVVTGALLHPNLPSIGANKVSVPEFYYKALLSKDRSPKGIALLLPTDASGDLSSFAITIDELESLLRLNFFSGAFEEERVEADLDLTDWDFRSSPPAIPCKGQGLFEPGDPAFFQEPIFF